GTVTFSPLWTGNTVITATATGCGGPLTSTHTVSIAAAVGAPVFMLGTNSTRCQGASSITYTANAANSTGITYSLDPASIAGGHTIDPATGTVTYVAGWTSATVITASADGCNGPRTSNHTVTTTPYVGVPVFALGAGSSRCQGAGTTVYSASATNSTGITYSLNAAAITGGCTINPAE